MQSLEQNTPLGIGLLAGAHTRLCCYTPCHAGDELPPAAGGWAGTKVSGLVVAEDPSSAAEAGGLTRGLVLT